VRRALAVLALLLPVAALAEPPRPSTFSIVAADPAAGEVGVAVASRFFAVGAVVPWARAGVGAVATQAFADTSLGPRGLELLARGVTPQEALDVMLRADDSRRGRQVGIVSASGASATYSGEGTTPWAGGRSGPGYAVQGNILTGENVVVAMESSFLASAGKPLAERLFLAMSAGDAAGGDSRGRQSIAVMVYRANGGYGGKDDRAIDLRVDDHADPFGEMSRLVKMGLVNDRWNLGWTAFTQKRFPDALKWQEETARLAESVPGMLPEVLYDQAVIRLANGDPEGALAALKRAVALNPKLATQAQRDEDMAALRSRLGEVLPR
jgi:uncharacterized Ntn-hydrolase superfamily protein